MKINNKKIITRVFALFVFSFLLLPLGSKDLAQVNAGFCSPGGAGSDPAVIGAPCTACLPPGQACGGEWTCCTGVGQDNGSGGVYCNVSSDPWCSPSVTSTPTPTPSQECPTNLTATCGFSGPNVTATFNWNEASPSVAERYILRVNRNDGENPEWVSTNDHWYYVDDSIGTCNGTNCTALLDQTTPKQFVQGSYLGWSVQTHTGSTSGGVSGCRIEGGPFACTMPDGNLSHACTAGQRLGALSYTLTIDNITNATNPFTHSTYILHVPNSIHYANDLTAYLGSPTWTDSGSKSYYIGRSYALSTTNPATIKYVWSTATSPRLGSNQRSVDDLANWMQANYPDTNLNVGANLLYNGVLNNWIQNPALSVKLTPTACVEGVGWGVDNVSVCWDQSVLGAEDQAEYSQDGEITIRPLTNKTNSDTSFINRILKAVSRAL